MATMSESIRKTRLQWKQKHLKSEEQNPFLLAGLDFLDMAKDFLDTGKRYKSRHHVWRDAAQPFNGLINLIAKPLYMIGRALIFSLFTPIYAIYNAIWGDGTLNAATIFKNGYYHVAGLLTRSLTAAIRGLTQLATTPLTGLRIIARGIYTAIKGWQPFTENNGTKASLAAAVSWVDSSVRDQREREKTRNICVNLQTKLKKAVSQGQPIDIDGTDQFQEMRDDIEKGDHVRPHRIYIKKTGPQSFSYVTTATIDPDKPTSKARPVNINLATLDPSFQGVFDPQLKQHRMLVLKIVIDNGHIDPADIVIDAHHELDDYFILEDKQEKAMPIPLNDGKFNVQGLVLAKSYLQLFGASFTPSTEPEERRPAYQWDAKRHLGYL